MITAPHIRNRKGKEKLVALTCYTTPMAHLLDAQVDIMLVGESVGMVLYGLDSTLNVSLSMMVEHVKAVRRGTKHAFLLADLPFGSYQRSPEQAFVSAAKLLKAGAQGVKLEGGLEMADTVRFLVERGIPVVAHIGLKPQHVQTMGGYKKQGKTESEKKRMLAEAKAHEQAGAFAILLEGTEEKTAIAITKAVRVPTIGIGASTFCDGQILVTEDMLGMFDHTPSFVTRHAEIAQEITKAVARYVKATRK